MRLQESFQVAVELGRKLAQERRVAVLFDGQLSVHKVREALFIVFLSAEKGAHVMMKSISSTIGVTNGEELRIAKVGFRDHGDRFYGDVDAF